jgi:hypothetical protein
MLLNADRYPLPADAPPDAAAAAHSLAVLPAGALYREPRGAISPRPMIPNEDTQRAIASLGAAVERNEELAPEMRVGARAAVLRQWRSDRKEVRGQSLRAEKAERFANELLETRFVSDATFAAARDALGERSLVNLMVFMGYSNILCAQQALAGAECRL